MEIKIGKKAYDDETEEIEVKLTLAGVPAEEWKDVKQRLLKLPVFLSKGQKALAED